MAEGITLLDFNVEPTKGINEVIKGAYEAIKSGLLKAKAKRLHAFKVMGENRFIVVAEGDVDPALYEMNEKYGDKIRVFAKPLRTYFSFVEKTLKVDKEIIPTEVKDLSPGGNMYWIDLHITYKGMTIENLIDTWKRESTVGLQFMKKNNTEFSAFKAIMQKDVHIFIKNSPDDADESDWKLPMFREMGNKMSAVCKPIKCLE